MIVLLVVVGAAVGAPARYLLDRAVQARHSSALPWGTLSVNVAASLLLGVVAGAAASERVSALVATGFCGALSTFSTFSLETVRLVEQRRGAVAAVNVAVSVLAGLGAVALGFVIGQALWT